MSRSHKKHPFVSVCTIRSGEMKSWKKECSKKIRRKPLDEEIGNFSTHKRSTERWSAPDDGKFFCHKDSQWVSDPNDIKKLMRK